MLLCFLASLQPKKHHKYDPHKEGNPQSTKTPLSDVSIGVRDFKEPKRLMDVSSHNVKF